MKNLLLLIILFTTQNAIADDARTPVPAEQHADVLRALDVGLSKTSFIDCKLLRTSEDWDIYTEKFLFYAQINFTPNEDQYLEVSRGINTLEIAATLTKYTMTPEEWRKLHGAHEAIKVEAVYTFDLSPNEITRASYRYLALDKGLWIDLGGINCQKYSDNDLNRELRRRADEVYRRSPKPYGWGKK
jgi:hypothetical protein